MRKREHVLKYSVRGRFEWGVSHEKGLYFSLYFRITSGPRCQSAVTDSFIFSLLEATYKKHFYQRIICSWNMFFFKNTKRFLPWSETAARLWQFHVPLLRLCGSVSLPSVFEPVADLRGGQSRGLGQLPLFPRGRVWVVRVPLSQHPPGFLLKAVACLLTVPYRAGQREFPPYPVLPYSSERPAPQFLRLHVVRLEPELLQLRMVVRGKLVALQDLIKLSEVPPMEGHHRLGFEDALVLVEVITSGQRPQEAAEPLQVSTLLQHLANARHLLLCKPEGR